MTSKLLLIVYGSGTGTAQDCAECLWRDATARNVLARVMSLGSYKLQNLCAERCVIFVIATGGQGEMTRDIRNNWKLMCRRVLPNDWLSNVHFAVLGLGDSSYPKYNIAGKKIFRRMCNLGAKPIIDLMLADDQHEFGIYGKFEQFRVDVFTAVFEMCMFKDMFGANDDLQLRYPPRYSSVTYDEEGGIANDDNFLIKSSFVTARIRSTKRVTSLDHFQETRLIGVELPHSLRYKLGDVLMISPNNLNDSVDIAVQALGLDEKTLDERFYVIPKIDCEPHPSGVFEGPTSLRICLRRYFDLQMVPRKFFFQLMYIIAEDEMERERLLELSSLQGYDDYLDYCYRPRRTVAETLRDFHQTAKSITRERLFEILTPIKPRAFSIASCPSIHSAIQILVAKVEFKSKLLVEHRRGLCSTFLCGLAENDNLSVDISPGTFIPPPADRPFIAIGTGTGIAPLRGIILAFDKENRESVLIFGCRHENKDYYFANEWVTLKCTRVITAFSRKEILEKEYVQHKIIEHGDYLWELIGEKNGSLLISGRAGDMPDAVLNAFKEISAKYNVDGEKFVASLESGGRIQYEVWN